MATGAAVKRNHQKSKKNRSNKISLVFDESKRREFLTGFHKRKLQRKKQAKEKLERDLKEERKRLKTEAKESYKKLVVSHRNIPELETLLQEEYVDEDVTVKVVELSTNDLAQQNNWIGANRPCVSTSDNEEEIEEEDATDEIPGMELKKRKVVKEKPEIKQTFDSEKDVKRLLKKEATRKVKKSKIFQKKNKMEKQKQKKKSVMQKTHRINAREKKNKKKHL